MALRGEVGWNATYTKQYGDRWPKLRAALAAPVRHVCLLNQFQSQRKMEELRTEYHLTKATIPLTFDFEIPEKESIPLETVENDDIVFVEKSAHALMPMYFLDGASVVAALALRPGPGDKVLDMCAAPGGKSLVMATQMFPADKEEHTGMLVCNEFSKARAQRLQDVLREFLPPTITKEWNNNLHFVSVDATTKTNSLERFAPYDRILVDAPCSSDRHMIHGKTVNKWTSGIHKVNAERQLSLLMNAVWMLAPGGTMVYSTCSLSDVENDGVVERFLRKAKKNFKLEVLPMTEEELSWLPGFAAEHCDWGSIILPDKSTYGPIYLAKIRKVK